MHRQTKTILGKRKQSFHLEQTFNKTSKKLEWTNSIGAKRTLKLNEKSLMSSIPT